MKERTPSHRLQRRNWDSPVTPRGDRQADLKADRQAEQKQAHQWARSQLLRTFAQTAPQTQGQNTPPASAWAAMHPLEHSLERRIEWRLRALKQATRQVWICETRQANQWRALAVLRLLDREALERERLAHHFFAKSPSEAFRVPAALAWCLETGRFSGWFLRAFTDGESLTSRTNHARSLGPVARCEARRARWLEALARGLEALQQLPRPAALPRLNPSQELEQLGAAQLPDRMKKKLTSALALIEELPSVWCHGDFHPANVCFGTEGLTVFDWEYTSWGPRGLDLANFSLYFPLRADEKEKLCRDLGLDSKKEAFEATQWVAFVLNFLWAQAWEKKEKNAFWTRAVRAQIPQLANHWRP